MTRVESVIKNIQNDIIGKNILEVACGCSEFSISASKISQSISCIDLESFRLKPEISECKNVTFQQMDATNMSFENNSFDTIIIYNATGHLEEVLISILSECQRVLKKGGYIYFISSFKMDKAIIEGVLIAELKKLNMEYDIKIDKIFTYLKIKKYEKTSL